MYYAPSYRVLVNNRELHERGSDFLSVQFKDSIKELSGFELTLNNWDDGGEGTRPGFKYSNEGSRLELGNQVEIFLGYADERPLARMIVGEITAMDPQFPASGAPTVTIRGLDRLHRWRNRPKSEPWKDKTDSDIARAIADANHTKHDVTPTSLVYRHVPQDNVDDHPFLLERAKRLNFEVFVRDDVLLFRPPAEAEKSVATLEWGTSLISFSPSLTMAQQVTKVTVRCWHPTAGRLIEKTVTRDQLDRGKGRGKDAGQILQDQFREEKEEVISREGVLSDEDAEKLATSVLLRSRESFVTGSAQTFGNPDIRAGRTIELSRLGQRFDGKYYVTESAHRLDNSGYTTTFTVRKVH
jgi:phage protein D